MSKIKMMRLLSICSLYQDVHCLANSYFYIISQLKIKRSKLSVNKCFWSANFLIMILPGAKYYDQGYWTYYFSYHQLLRQLRLSDITKSFFGVISCMKLFF